MRSAGDLFPVLLQNEKRLIARTKCQSASLWPQKSRTSSAGEEEEPSSRSGREEEEMTAEPTTLSSPASQLVAAKDKEVRMTRHSELMKSLPNSMTHAAVGAVTLGKTNVPKCREINRQRICTHALDLTTGRNGERKEQHD